jgi:hypothetical protein
MASAPGKVVWNHLAALPVSLIISSSEICRGSLVGRDQPQELGKPVRDILARLTLEGGTNLLQCGSNHVPCGWTSVTRHESGKAVVGRSAFRSVLDFPGLFTCPCLRRSSRSVAAQQSAR